MQLIFKTPINSLSFGQVSYNLLKQFMKLGVETSVFPVGNSVDLSAYNPTPEFSEWLRNSINSRFYKLNKDIASLSLWHLNGSEESIGRNPYLYTFHELSRATAEEMAITCMFNKVMCSSSYTAKVFDGSLEYIPIGFDEEFKPSDRRKFPDDMIHFILVGKFEKRKNTAQILRLWAEKYGDKRDYQLTCLIGNPFMDNEKLSWELTKALGGKRYFNINFMPFLKKNADVNDLINSADIDLSGLSGAEGWGLPAFNATCLGKWSCVLNATAHKDWATSENSILVEPNGTTSAEDGVFFQKGGSFNQGSVFTASDDSILEAFERSEKVARTKNFNGTLLAQRFTYEKTAKEILSHIFGENAQ